ncbi:MAG: AmmeMemoRadiSam system protein A [Gammaproteobacteria bacterium]|nr:AmmeMemoRadiSam system protein A [Gammaproteobacteria bacterium]
MLLDAAARALLLRVARQSIAQRFGGHSPLSSLDDAAPALREKRATFVTLKHHGALRGCVGVLEPLRTLLEDVAHNARTAAFHDPRFPPLEPAELPGVHISISILSTAMPLMAPTRQELLKALRPGVDGLIVREGPLRATFLPSVWETLPQADDFVAGLLQKAGLAAGHWSPALSFFRYRTESFCEGDRLSSG